MVSVIWADGLWICCRFGEATWRIPRKRTWRHGCTLISASKTLVWDSSYSDVLADCDAWLLARSMQSNSSERSLSTAMRDMFAQSETNRIKRFYQSRFKGSADNLVIAFRKLVDGIDLGIFDNVSGSKKALLIASHADRLPSQAEAGILALSYAESLENPNR